MPNSQLQNFEPVVRPVVPPFHFDEIPKPVYGAMEGAVAFAEELCGYTAAHQPHSQFSDGSYTLWQWIYDDFAEHWGGFPGMWQLAINAGWACQKVIEALGDEFAGDFIELIQGGLVHIDEDMLAGNLTSDSFTEAYFVDMWLDTYIEIENATRARMKTHTQSPS
jgi:hypothetical protein